MTHTIREGLGGPVLREWTADTLDMVARVVCERCNTGWMSDLEIAAKPLLLPLLRGNLHVLDGPSQRVVAAWAVKTALAMALANTPPRPIEAIHYRSMTRARLRPPPNTFVWLAAYRGPRHAFHAPRSLMLTGTSGGSAEAYASTFNVGRPIFHVVGHSHNERLAFTKGGAWPRMTAQIWPVMDLTPWPPPMILDDDALLALAASWG